MTKHKLCLKLCMMMLCLLTPPSALSADLLNTYLNRDESYFKQNLSPEVYATCREKSTEKSGSGQYDNFWQDGTYYCACCGGDYPLYSAAAKFDSKTGWPSFTAPISPTNVKEQPDNRILSRLYGATTEVVCARCGSHIGHVFNDGPPPTHRRFCMNSRAMVFVPKGQTPKRLFPE